MRNFFQNVFSGPPRPEHPWGSKATLENMAPHTWANWFWSIYMGFYMDQLYGLEVILKKYSTFFMDQLYGFGLKFLGIIWTKICWDTRFLITLFFLQARAARNFFLGTNYKDFCLSKFFLVTKCMDQLYGLEVILKKNIWTNYMDLSSFWKKIYGPIIWTWGRPEKKIIWGGPCSQALPST